MNWSAALITLLVSHVVGDVLLQTDRQALLKRRGLGDPVARLALLAHLATYTVAFVPALVWISVERSPGRAAVVGALVAVPHLLIDDGRLVRAWMREVKRAPEPALGLVIAVDQSFHLLCLLGAALIAAG